VGAASATNDRRILLRDRLRFIYFCELTTLVDLWCRSGRMKQKNLKTESVCMSYAIGRFFGVSFFEHPSSHRRCHHNNVVNALFEPSLRVIAFIFDVFYVSCTIESPILIFPTRCDETCCRFDCSDRPPRPACASDWGIACSPRRRQWTTKKSFMSIMSRNIRLH
jgi:hypothetical protein